MRLETIQFEFINTRSESLKCDRPARFIVFYISHSVEQREWWAALDRSLSSRLNPHNVVQRIDRYRMPDLRIQFLRTLDDASSSLAAPAAFHLGVYTPSSSGLNFLLELTQELNPRDDINTQARINPRDGLHGFRFILDKCNGLTAPISKDPPLAYNGTYSVYQVSVYVYIRNCHFKCINHTKRHSISSTIPLETAYNTLTPFWFLLLE